jgi:hypothetical protein
MLTFYLYNPHFEYYWFFDDDVSFDGDLSALLNIYSGNFDDFVAIQAFKSLDCPGLPCVPSINADMGSNGEWLSFCPGPGDNFKSSLCHVGSFFPIVRFSRKALSFLWDIHQDGFYGYSEGFVPTSLASEGFSVSSMMSGVDSFYAGSIPCTLFHKLQTFSWKWI